MLILPTVFAAVRGGAGRGAKHPDSGKPDLTARFCKNVCLSAALILALGAGSVALGAKPTREAAAEPPAATTPTEPNAAELAASVVNHGDGVAAIVNDSVISDYDLRQRIALFIATSGVRPTGNTLNAIRDQVLKQLETEQMELLEAKKDNISVSAADVDRAINEIVTSNHLSMDQLKSVLAQGGVDIATLRAQLSVQIAWSKLVQDQLGDRVHVAPEDVDAELAKIKAGANEPRYLVSEIFQSVDAPDQDGKVLKDMTNLDNQIQLGAPFAAVARQFSQNPMAAQGGDLGWVQDGQVPPELMNRIKTMNAGDVSQPIRATGGYYIVQLRDKQEPVGTKIVEAPQSATPPGTLPLVRILLPMGAKPDKVLLDRALQAASVVRAHIRDCEQSHDIAGKVPGSVFMNLGAMKLSDLSAEMQSAIAKAGPGKTTEPFLSSAGVELIVRCDKAVPKESVMVIPTRAQVEEQLYEQQMTILARRYLRDLRREADVETR
jgi:peptidyl-prolyl cis-trans isomerase SurA